MASLIKALVLTAYRYAWIILLLTEMTSTLPVRHTGTKQAPNMYNTQSNTLLSSIKPKYNMTQMYDIRDGREMARGVGRSKRSITGETSILKMQLMDIQGLISEIYIRYCHHRHDLLVGAPYQQMESNTAKCNYYATTMATDISGSASLLELYSQMYTFNRLLHTMLHNGSEYLRSGCFDAPNRRNPCDIGCNRSRRPEQRLYCDIHRKEIVSRFRDLSEAIKTKYLPNAGPTVMNRSRQTAYGENTSRVDIAKTNIILLYHVRELLKTIDPVLLK